MKRFPLFLALILGGFMLMGADGCSSDPNVEGAKLDLRNKDYDRALENLETALTKNPDNAEALEMKGRVLQEKAFTINDVAEHTAMIEEMLTAYERAASLDPTLQAGITQQLRVVFYNEFNRGIQAFNRASDDSAEYATASSYFANASLIQPDSTGPYVNHAFALVNAGDQEGAIVPLTKAVDLGESSADVYILLADLHRTTGNAEKAVEVLEKASEMYPEDENVTAQKLNAYTEAGLVDRALNEYRRNLESDPDNRLYRYNLGSLLLQTENYEEAITHLARAVELDPTYANAFYNLGVAHVNKAVEVSEEISTIDDEVRESTSMSAEDKAAKEAEMERLASERMELFKGAISPLEQARTLISADGGDVTGICAALFQAYVQTGDDQKGKEVAECAGIDLGD